MHKQSSIIVGLVLILAGLLFLLLQAFPEFASQIDLGRHWPFLIVAIGIFLLLGALFSSPPLAVPGMVVTGIGSLLAYQNATGNWATWAFAWSLIPGFVGLGVMLMGLLDPTRRSQVRDGARLVFISLILFLVFGGFFGAFGQFWPLLLIAGGILLLLRGRRREKPEEMPAADYIEEAAEPAETLKKEG